MNCRSDLGLNKRSATRVLHACELRGQSLQAVEGAQIAEKLRCQTLLIDNRLDNARKARVLGETGPCAAARALEIDCGDLSVRRRWTGLVGFDDRAHFATLKGSISLSGTGRSPLWQRENGYACDHQCSPADLNHRTTINLARLGDHDTETNTYRVKQCGGTDKSEPIE